MMGKGTNKNGQKQMQFSFFFPVRDLDHYQGSGLIERKWNSGIKGLFNFDHFVTGEMAFKNCKQAEFYVPENP